MIILRKRSKFFAESQTAAMKSATPDGQSAQQAPSQQQAATTSNELLIEQYRLQRLMLQTQKQRQMLRAQEERDRLRRLNNAQKVEQRKDEVESKNALRVKALENDSQDQAKNVGLYKTKSTAVAPVPMKK